jgi:hypothetical protein
LVEELKESHYFKIKIYSCYLYSSWEKGSFENRNMFIRIYFSNKIDLSQVTDDLIYEVQEKLNNRPMKCFGYRTPNEILFFEQFGMSPPINETILLPPPNKMKRSKMWSEGDKSQILKNGLIKP